MQIVRKLHFIESKKAKAKTNGREVKKMSQKIVIRNDFSCRVSQVKKSDGHSALRSVAYISGRKLVNEATGEEHNFSHKKGVIDTGFLLPENVKSNVSDAEFFQHLENNCHASTNTIAYSAIMALPKELSVEDQKKLVQDFCKHFTDTYKTAVSFAIHEPDNYERKKATLREIERYNLPSDIEKLEKETRNNHVHLVMPYCQVEALTEKDLTAKRKKKQVGNGFKLGKQVKDFNPIKYGSEIKKDKPDLLNPKQKFAVFMRENWCEFINDKLIENNRIERYTHKSYKRLGLDIAATKHEGELVKSRVANGATMDVHEYNMQQKEKQLTQPDYLNFINRPIPAELAEKILSGDFAQEREAIAELKNKQADELDLLHKLVRDCDEADLRIDQTLEQRQLQREQQEELRRLKEQHQKQQKIEQALDDFIVLQNEYIEFAQWYESRVNSFNKAKKEIEKNFEKSEKWVSKLSGVYRHYDDLFYDDYHHKFVSLDTPNYYITRSTANKKLDEMYEQIKHEVFEKSKEIQIEKTIESLKHRAEFLNEHEVDLPTPKPNFWKKMVGEKVHSFDTIDDFEYAQQLINERKDDISAAQHAYRQNQLLEQRLELRRKEAEKEREALRLENEARNKLERENRLRLERAWSSEPKPDKKPENRNDNDFLM